MSPSIGRNDPCPCGSGKKYKHCCLARPADAAADAAAELPYWKEADTRVIRRGMDRLDHAGLNFDKAAKQFFGSLKALRQLMASPQGEMVSQQFHDWLWMDYRPSSRQPTVAERLLAAGPLPADEHAILQEKVSCPISLYQVVEVYPGRSLVLEDLLREQRVEVTDRLLSQSAPRYVGLPVRVYPAGPYHFASGLGVPIPPHLIPETLAWLKAKGLAADSAESLRAHAYLFGRLWPVVNEWTNRPIRLTNTDGEPLVLCTATYTVKDPAALESALARRTDLDQDPGTGEWVWAGTTPGMGEGVTLARLRLEGRKLLVEVNSRERLRRVKVWVERIPGLSHLGDETKSVEEMRTAARAEKATRMPEEPPPELVELVRQQMAQHYEQWLDMPLPALQGRTPREAVRAEGGRRAVTLLLREMAYRSAPGGAGIPDYDFNRLRRALGLPEE